MQGTPEWSDTGCGRQVDLPKQPADTRPDETKFRESGEDLGESTTHA